MEEQEVQKAEEIQKNDLVEIKRTEISVSETGLLQPKTIDESYRVANAFFRSGLLPTRFKTAESVFTAIQLALELNLKPLTALRQIAVINGTPSLYGDLPLSLCYASGKIEYFKESLIDKDGQVICAKNNNLNADVFAAVCIAKRKGDTEEAESSFTMSQATKAGLTGGPVWKNYPQRMLRYRARGQLLKDKFPDVLNGISIAEYDFNTIPEGEDAIVINEKTDTGLAAELKEKLKLA